MDWCDNNSEDLFYIDIGDFISTRSILLADINQVKYLVKTARTDVDGNAVVSLTLGAGIEKVAGDTEADAALSVQFDASDFGPSALNTSSAFYAGVAIKTASMTDFLEVKLTDDELNILNSFFA